MDSEGDGPKSPDEEEVEDDDDDDCRAVSGGEVNFEAVEPR
jgi:hypothetical protein